jgi:hypothetical protein
MSGSETAATPIVFEGRAIHAVRGRHRTNQHIDARVSIIHTARTRRGLLTHITEPQKGMMQPAVIVNPDTTAHRQKPRRVPSAPGPGIDGGPTIQQIHPQSVAYILVMPGLGLLRVIHTYPRYLLFPSYQYPMRVVEVPGRKIQRGRAVVPYSISRARF